MVRAGRLVTTPGRAALSSCATGLVIWKSHSVQLQDCMGSCDSVVGSAGSAWYSMLEWMTDSGQWHIVHTPSGEEHGENFAEGVA
jgi:hypothetical protein